MLIHKLLYRGVLISERFKYRGSTVFQLPEIGHLDVSATPLFQHPEMGTPLYTVELLYSNTLKWGHLCIQWNSSIPTPWNEDTSVYSGTPLFQHPEMRTPLYTVELLYSNTLKWGHLCIQWNSSIPTPWNEDTSVYSGTPLFQHPEMRTPLYTVEPLYFNPPWHFVCLFSVAVNFFFFLVAETWLLCAV